MTPLRIFFFPDSAALRERWWHRLVTVAIWSWVAYLVIALIKAMFLDPHQACISAKFSMYSDGTLDCGSGILDYALQSFANTSWTDTGLLTLLVAAMGYLAILAPSLAYRVILYIGTGGNWKNWGTP